jgi:hypothetical protein
VVGYVVFATFRILVCINILIMQLQLVSAATVNDISLLFSLSVCAFHIKYDNMKLHTNVGRWSVNVIELSHDRRHLDLGALRAFWDKLDK